MNLSKHLVEKPWGRADIPAAFGDMDGQRIGEIWYEGSGDQALPILVKWLFTSERLSIQVHPDDMQASLRGRASGKEECWVVVDAEPGAVLGIGTIVPLDAGALREASQSGEIERLMDWKPVSAGDFYYIPAGTVHAIGAGITLVEVQQYADITYRLYDYGRPRELHLDDGLAVSEARPYTDARSGKVSGNCQLVDGPHFRLWHIATQSGLDMLPDADHFWLTPIEGSVQANSGSFRVGDCALVNGSEKFELAPDSRLLVATL